MKPKVFIAKPIPKEVEDYIGGFCDYEIWEKKESISNEILFEKIKNIDGLMTSNSIINEEFLKEAPYLKIVSNIAVGYDGFDIKSMKERNVLGTNTPYVLDETVADLVFGLIIMTSRKLGTLNQYVKEGYWNILDSEDFFGYDVNNSTLGIIGMGRIGEKVARRASLGFNMKVIYNNRTRRPGIEKKLEVSYSELEPLLETSDYVLLMLPFTDSTYQFFGDKEFKKMKTSSFFFNCSRGKTVDEKALIQALQSKGICGAGLDVYEVEPINKDNPLLKMDNVVTLPHIGSATEKARFDMAMRAAENLVAGVTGQVPPNIVNELKELV